MRYILYFILIIFLFSCSLEKRRYNKGYYFQRHSSSRNYLYSKEESKNLISDLEVECANSSSLKCLNDSLTVCAKELIVPQKMINNRGLDHAIDSTGKIIIISEKVGVEIDSAEKSMYKLFPFWSKADFKSARFVQYPGNKIFLEGLMKDGTMKKIFFTPEQLNEFCRNYFNENSSFQADDAAGVYNNKTQTENLRTSPLPFISFLAIILGFVLLVGAIGSLEAFFFGLFLVIFGTILSFVALVKMARKEVSKSDKALAILNVVLGLLILVLLGMLLLFIALSI